MIHKYLQIILTSLSQELKQLYGDRLADIILYGSQARGDAEPDSDIDILILLFEPFDYFQESDRISVLIANLCLTYNVLISCGFTTKEKFEHQNTGFLRNIRREGIIV